MAELKEANRYSSDPLECRRHSKKRSMRRTRERARLSRSVNRKGTTLLQIEEGSRSDPVLGPPCVHTLSRNGSVPKTIGAEESTHYSFYKGSYTNGYDEEANLASEMWQHWSERPAHVPTSHRHFPAPTRI